jgi:hypothetical protein
VLSSVSLGAMEGRVSSAGRTTAARAKEQRPEK